MIATKNRVPPPTNLRDDLASGDMSKWTFLETLPSSADMSFMQQMFVVLVGRILVKRMKWMGEYKLEESVVKEVEHAYSEEMRQKSEEVRATREFSGHAEAQCGCLLCVQHSIGLRNLYEVTQIDEIINWIHELIAGVNVIKTGEKKADGKGAARAATGSDSGSSACSLTLTDDFFSCEPMQSSGNCCHRLECPVE